MIGITRYTTCTLHDSHATRLALYTFPLSIYRSIDHLEPLNVRRNGVADVGLALEGTHEYAFVVDVVRRRVGSQLITDRGRQCARERVVRQHISSDEVPDTEAPLRFLRRVEFQDLRLCLR